MPRSRRAPSASWCAPARGWFSFACAAARRAAATRPGAWLEVRSHEVPFLIEDGQVVGRLIYERLTGRPDKLYGVGIGSSYQRQFLALSKQFKPIQPRPIQA